MGQSLGTNGCADNTNPMPVLNDARAQWSIGHRSFVSRLSVEILVLRAGPAARAQCKCIFAITNATLPSAKMVMAVISNMTGSLVQEKNKSQVFL